MARKQLRFLAAMSAFALVAAVSSASAEEQQPPAANPAPAAAPAAAPAPEAKPAEAAPAPAQPQAEAPKTEPAPATAESKTTEAPAAETKPGETKAAETKPAEAASPPAETKATEAPAVETKPAETKPADTKATEAKPSEPPPADAKPAETKATETKPADTKPAKPALATLNGMPVRSWGYQLQGNSVDVIAASPYDVIVMDYSRESSQEAAFTPEELARMKVKPDGSRRIVISYISIGEAESYRYYWAEKGWTKKANRPKWIGKENPEWKGNYSVNFWEDGWQNIILHDDDSYMNRIMKAGFDGVYLDKIDIAYDLMGKSPKGTDAIDLMVDFVISISETLKAKNPNFLIFPQNAEGLLSNAEYRKAVDGIGKEDLLFREEEVGDSGVYKDGQRNPQNEVDASVGLLKQLKADGRTILVVEYLHSKADIQASAKKFADWGFVSYFGPRDLGKLVPLSQQPTAIAASARVASACAGRDEATCGTTEGCMWLPGYEASPGTEIAGQCRNAARSIAARHKPSAAARAAGASKKALTARQKGLLMRGSDERETKDEK